MSTALTGTCGSVRIVKTQQGQRVHVLHYANAPVLTRKKLDAYLAWKDLCSVLNVRNSNELSKV